jgi:cytochrome bd-type quinol oxidase subunit 2
MTPAIVGGIVAVVVVLLAGLAWVVARTRRVVKIDTPEEAADAAQAQLPGFAVAGAVVGADGQGALAIAADGRVAAVRRIGKRLAVREVSWRTVRATREGILVETGDRTLGAVMLAQVDVLDIRRLAPKGVRV